MKIGDHDFVLGVCLKCGRKWADLRHIDHSYLSEKGYACSGALTASEITEYVAQREREDAAIAEAFAGLSR